VGARRLGSREVLRYLLALGLPVAFLSVLAPAWLAPGLPALVANVFSDVRYMRTVEFHYATSIVPFLYLAAIHGAARVARVREPPSASVSSRSVFLPVRSRRISCSASCRFRTPTGSYRLAKGYRAQAVRTLTDAVERVPDDAVVSADYSLVPHLTHRQRVYMFPNPFRTENWAFANDEPHDAAAIQYVIVRKQIIREKGQHVIDSLLDAGLFVRELGTDDVSIYRRVATLRDVRERRVWRLERRR
jgi:uncharacterized membrane protein